MFVVRAVKSTCTALLRKLTIPKFIACVVIFTILNNEYLSYIIKSLRWANLSINSSHPSEQLRVLFVADPQLIGLRDEIAAVGPFSRWDSDRYLRRTFRLAYSHVQPHIIVYLGDLLDEGSNANNEDYETYISRFENIFYTPPNVKHIYTSGDNDVGGEGFDRKEQFKTDRFKKYFMNLKNPELDTGVTNVRFLDFFRLYSPLYESSELLSETLSKMSEYAMPSNFRVICNHFQIWDRLLRSNLDYDWGQTWDGGTRRRVEEAVSTFQGSFPILLNHMSLLTRPHSEYQPMLQTTKSSMIFTAHTHTARIYNCLNCRQSEYMPQGPGYGWKGSSERMSDYSVRMFNIKDSSVIREIAVPTCSYRMGVPQMGYGAAIFDAKGTVKYTVLWTPSRYFQLFSYLWVLSLIFLLYVIHSIRQKCCQTRHGMNGGPRYQKV